MQAPPTAVDDVPDMLSAPGEAYHTALNTPLDSTSHPTPPVLDNDDRGFPLADVVSYGTSGSPTDQTVPGAPTPTDDGGTVVVSADGNFVYTPPSPTFTGPDFFGYRIDNGAGFDDAVVTIAVGIRPACDDEVDPDDYDALGNVGITVPDGSGVLIGDTGDEISVTGNTAPVERRHRDGGAGRRLHLHQRRRLHRRRHVHLHGGQRLRRLGGLYRRGDGGRHDLVHRQRGRRAAATARWRRPTTASPPTPPRRSTTRATSSSSTKATARAATTTPASR